MSNSSEIKYEHKGESIYLQLQRKTEERLRSLTGKIWTAMYVHDPGVTINDVLNYLLTDFNYKLQFAIEDYLCREDRNLDLELLGLFDQLQISLTSVVTPNDYQELILNRIPEVYIVHVIPLNEDNIRGVYRIEAQIDSDVTTEQYERIKKDIEQLYYTHRNLCEDLEEVVLTAASKGMKRKQLYDFRNYLNDERTQYPQGKYRNIFDHVAARHDFPDFYGINDWGLSSEASEERKIQAEQLKNYLDLFDGIIERGLEEIKLVPDLLQLNPESSAEEQIDIKLQYLDMLDRMYGENSNPAFMMTREGDKETGKCELARRANFLRQIPFWGRDRHKSSWMNPNPVFGAEMYINSLLELGVGESVRFVEHIIFRNLPKTIQGMNNQFVDFPIDLYLSVFLHGRTKRMRNSSFKKGLEEIILKRIPAHLEVAIYWLYEEDTDRFDLLYTNYIAEPSEKNAEALKSFIVRKRAEK